MKSLSCSRCPRLVGLSRAIPSEFGPQCPDCLAYLEPTTRKLGIDVAFRVLLIALCALLFGVVAVMLAACGPAFTAAAEADPLVSSAGAGGYTQTLPQAGAGGGSHYSTGPGGASGSTGGAPAGSAGTAAENGGASAIASGGSSGQSGGVAGGPPDPVHGCTDRSGWSASASSGSASLAIDSDPASTWSCGSGGWLELALGARLQLVAFVVHSTAPIPPLRLELDGAPVKTSMAYAAGDLQARISFDAAAASRVRITISGSSASELVIADVSAVCQ